MPDRATFDTVLAALQTAVVNAISRLAGVAVVTDADIAILQKATADINNLDVSQPAPPPPAP